VDDDDDDASEVSKSILHACSLSLSLATSCHERGKLLCEQQTFLIIKFHYRHFERIRHSQQPSLSARAPQGGIPVRFFSVMMIIYKNMPALGVCREDFHGYKLPLFHP
jgi:hypothetical protein